MSSLTDSNIGFTLKMESVSKNAIFVLKMKVKRGLENWIWNPSKWEDGYFYYRICDFGHLYEIRKIVSNMKEFQKDFV